MSVIRLIVLLWPGPIKVTYKRLPSGSFRVKVYAGTDPVTGKERLLRQTCPDEASAYVALGRMLAEADGGRFPTGMRLSARPSTST